MKHSTPATEKFWSSTDALLLELLGVHGARELHAALNAGAVVRIVSEIRVNSAGRIVGFVGKDGEDPRCLFDISAEAEGNTPAKPEEKTIIEPSTFTHSA